VFFPWALSIWYWLLGIVAAAAAAAAAAVSWAEICRMKRGRAPKSDG